MRIMDVPHIAIIPFITCNFACSYCCASTHNPNTLNLWHKHESDMIHFLNTLDTKMIMVSGGEPLLYNWQRIIDGTSHYWYFCTNGSIVPKYGSERVKLFIPAYHRTQIGIDKFVNNLLRMQENIAVFCKIVYTQEPKQFDDWEAIARAGIPVSFTPLLGMKYDNDELAKILPYCMSIMYAKRFLNTRREPAPCIAGTGESFEINGSFLARCSHYDSPALANKPIPNILKRIRHDGRGDIYTPKFDESAGVCRRRVCECEWHSLGDLNNSGENKVWQKLIDTGKWTSITFQVPISTGANCE